ncbi:MAG: hypothetical protein GY928_16635 [Colwellia sp.]|nr:hypothetical protein [Colwellia sp.]
MGDIGKVGLLTARGYLTTKLAMRGVSQRSESPGSRTLNFNPDGHSRWDITVFFWRGTMEKKHFRQ